MSGDQAPFIERFSENEVIQFSSDTSVLVEMFRNATHLDFQVMYVQGNAHDTNILIWFILCCLCCTLNLHINRHFNLDINVLKFRFLGTDKPKKTTYPLTIKTLC